MKDRAPKMMTEEELRFAAMGTLGQLYVRLQDHLDNPATTPENRGMISQNRWQILHRMSDQDRESVHSYERYKQDAAARARAAKKI